MDKLRLRISNAGFFDPLETHIISTTDPRNKGHFADFIGVPRDALRDVIRGNKQIDMAWAKAFAFELGETPEYYLQLSDEEMLRAITELTAQKVTFSKIIKHKNGEKFVTVEHRGNGTVIVEFRSESEQVCGDNGPYTDWDYFQKSFATMDEFVSFVEALRECT